MTKREFNEVKELWKLIHAGGSFKSAIDSVAHILNYSLTTSDDLYMPLLTAFYTFYAKPFTESRSSKLGVLKSDVLPKDSKPIHDEILDLRNSLFVHSDAHNLKTDKYGPVLQATFTFKANVRPTVHTSTIGLMPEKLEIMKRHVGRVNFLTQEKMVKLIDLLHPHKPTKDGQYILNVYDISLPVWITYQQAKGLLPADAKSLMITEVWSH